MTISLPRRRCVASLLAAGASIVGLVPTAFAASTPMDPSRLYRPIGATHLYRTYRDRIYQGRLPPLLYAIAITETELDERGNVVSAVVTREPAAAKEVGPWVVSMIRAASPFPPPAGQAGRLHYTDVWLVDRSYRFQLDTLTEGQD
jgi:hypothetical protein